MGDFEYLPHTADVGFRARGASLPDLFATAGQAMFGLEYDPGSVPIERTMAVTASGDDEVAALYGWLSELIWIHDGEGFVPASIRVDTVSPAVDGGLRVSGSATGADLGDWFEQTGPQLKAVTMYGLSVAARDGGYEATVYVDV